MRQADERMDMVWHDRQIMNLYFVLGCCLPDCSSNKVFILQLAHHLVAVLGTPFEVPEIASDFVAVMVHCYLHGLVLHERALTLFWMVGYAQFSSAD